MNVNIYFAIRFPLLFLYQIGRIYIVPPIALFMLNHPIVDNYDMMSVTSGLVGAAPMDEEATNAFKKKFPNMVLQQGIVKFLLKSSITNRQSLRYLCVTCVISFESSFCIHHPSLETLFFSWTSIYLYRLTLYLKTSLSRTLSQTSLQVRNWKTLPISSYF